MKNIGTCKDADIVISATYNGISVTEIGWQGFDQVKSLKSISLPEGLTSISDWAFSGCVGLSSITLPDSISTINSWVFYYCTGLRSVVFSNNVKTIKYNSFAACINLKQVFYKGTVEDRNAIEYPDGKNQEISSATWYYYSAEQPSTSGNYWHYVNNVPTVWSAVSA